MKSISGQYISRPSRGDVIECTVTLVHSLHLFLLFIPPLIKLCLFFYRLPEKAFNGVMSRW